jgi:TP901 family phage tail tape measure protein
MSVDLKVGIDQKHWLREVERGRKMAQQALNKSGAELKLKVNEKGFRQPLGRISGDLKQFDSALAASNARVIAFGASTAVIGGISKAFKELAKTTVEVGKAFSDINRILQMSNKDLSKFGNDLFEIGKKNATAFQDTTKAALEFARQGLKTEETLKRTSDALTLVRLTGINADKAVSSLTATVNAFDNAMVTTTSSVNKFVAVETKFAVGARDLVEAIGRVGSSAKDAKVGFDELNAMVTAVQQTTGRGGAVIGNAMKTIFTRLQRQSTLEALEAYGVAVKDVEGATLPAIRILDNFAKSYKGLADQNQAYLREQVAGVFQANILSAILRDLNKQQSTFSQALKVSVGATNEADQATAQLNKTLSALTTQTGLEFKRLQENIGRATFEPIAKALLDPLSSMMKGLNDIIDGEGAGSEIANGLLKGIKNVIGGPGFVAIVGLIGKVFLNTTSYLLKSLPALAGITTETQKRAQFEQIIETAMKSEANLADMIAAEEGNAARQAGIFAQHAEAAKLDLDAQEKSVKNIAATLMRMPKGTQTTVLAAGGGGKRGASGFIPGMAGEAHDIARGVGGVNRSAKPVTIPNFAFGGGVRGTMVANTGEHIVPNFKGGGSAIFNPNMIAQYGMPAGAKPIRGAGGYVPNFVDVNKANAGRMAADAGITRESHPSLFTKGGDIRVAALRANLQRKSGAKTSQGRFFDARQKAHMFVPQAGFKMENYPYIFGGGSALQKMSSTVSKDGKPVDGMLLNAYGPSLTASKRVQKGGNLAKVEDILDDSLRIAAENVIMAYSPALHAGKPVSKKKVEGSFLKEGGAGAMGAFKGALFEAVVDRLVGQQYEKGNQNTSTLDILLSGQSGRNAEDLFGITGTAVNATHADAKSSWSSGNRTKITEQIMKNFGKSLPITMGAAARGYVPNFAALGDAVEREAAAGVPLGSIRVGRSGRLAGPNNPAGLGVTNTRDEPRGLADVVGASRGYVPNYVDPMGVDVGGVVGKTNKQLAGLNNGFARFQRIIDKVALKLAKKEITESQAMRATQRLGAAAGKSGAALTTLQTRVKTTASTMATASGSKAGGIRGRMSALNTRMSGGAMGGMGVGMGLTMGAPMLAGAIEQGMGEGNPTGQTLSGALTGVGTGAAMGMMFGPLGAAIGGAVGGIGGLAYSAANAGKSLEQLDREVKEYEKSTSDNTSAAKEYIQASRDMAAAISPAEFEDAQKRLRKNFDAITDVNLQSSFAAAGTNVEEMMDQLKAYELRRMGTAVVGGAAAASRRQLDAGPGGLMRTAKTVLNAVISDPNVAGRARSFGGGFEGAGRYMTEEALMGTRTTGRGSQKRTGEIALHGAKKYVLDDTALSNLQKDFGKFFEIVNTATEDQMNELTKALNEEAGQMELDFGAGRIADMLINFGIGFKKEDYDNLYAIFQNLDDATDSRLFAIDRFEGTQDLKGFSDLVGRVLAFGKTAKDEVSKIDEKAEKAQESFIAVQASITRLTENLGAMVRSINNISKIRKAFTAERIDLLGGAGRGLSIGGFAQGEAAAGFQNQRTKLTATTAQANSLRLANQIKAGQSAAGDVNLRALDAAANLFSQDINAGLDAFAKFTSANSKEQEKLTKLINELRITYNDQLLNINLDEKITQAKNELEQKRRENNERQAILIDAMSAVENRRAMNLVDENAARQRRINVLQGSLEDPRNFRGTGFKRESGRISARAAIEQQISDTEFQTRRAEATQGSVRRANALLVQKQQIALDNELLKSQNSLNDTMQELIAEFQKQNALVRLGTTPNIETMDRFLSPEQQMFLGNDPDNALRIATGNYNAQRNAILSRGSAAGGASGIPESGTLPAVNISAEFGAGVFDYETEEKAAKNLAATLEGVKTQKEVIDVLDKRRSQLDDKDQVDQAEKRRIDALLREINLGKKKLDTEQAITDELRQQTRDREISLDQDARSFSTQFKEGMLDVYEETDYIYARLGRELPQAFRDGMVGAMETAMDKADSFGDAMRGVAVDMLKMMRRASLEYSMSNFTNLIGMGTSSGFRKSQRGSFIPGSGTGDKVPTLLEPGEYVMNRKAVKGIGRSTLDQMNFGAFPRFANGGSIGLDESVHSSRMSGFFLASDNPELAEAREAERARQAEKAEKSAQKKQLLSTFLSTVVSMGVGKLMSMGADKFGKKGLHGKGATGELTVTQNRNTVMTPLGPAPLLGKNKLPEFPGSQRGGHIGRGFTNRDSVPAYMAGGEFVMNNRAVRKYGLGFMGRLNGGVIPTMQAGGGVEAAPLNAQTGANTNNISINVSVGGSGSSGQGASESAGNANASEQSNVDQATQGKEMAERIRSAVLEVIGQEQRLGGSLSKKSRTA